MGISGKEMREDGKVEEVLEDHETREIRKYGKGLLCGKMRRIQGKEKQEKRRKK
jgi:hypothetical protein